MGRPCDDDIDMEPDDVDEDRPDMLLVLERVEDDNPSAERAVDEDNQRVLLVPGRFEDDDLRTGIDEELNRDVVEAEVELQDPNPDWQPLPQCAFPEPHHPC
jgi:hypothetical protein